MLRPFLSYQWNDKRLVDRIARALVETGMKPILDQWEFIPGESLTKSMNRGIQSASAFVLFWSKSAAGSKNVEYERELGLVEMKKRDDFRIICVLFDDTPPPDEHLFRLYINWQQRRRSFDQNVQQLSRAIRGQSLVQPPRALKHPQEREKRGELCFIYARDFAALKSAMSVVGDRLDSGPSESPAGLFITARIDRQTEATLTRSDSVSVYRKPHHKVETSKRKCIYVTQTKDVKRLEEIIGMDIESVRNWEATSMGLYIEADVSDQMIDHMRLLPSVTVFDEAQHALTDDDRRLHDRMQWSKRAALAAVSNTEFESVEEFAAAITAEFENICLVDLALKNVKVAVRDRCYSVHITMSCHESATPQQGSNTVNINDIMEGMKVFVATDRNIDAEDINFSITPVVCTDGIVITIEYSW